MKKLHQLVIVLHISAYHNNQHTLKACMLALMVCRCRVYLEYIATFYRLANGRYNPQVNDLKSCLR